MKIDGEPENYQNITHDKLRIIILTRLLFKFKKLLVNHFVLIAKSIAHKLIMGNNFITEHKFDINNSKGVILFGD